MGLQCGRPVIGRVVVRVVVVVGGVWGRVVVVWRVGGGSLVGGGCLRVH